MRRADGSSGPETTDFADAMTAVVTVADRLYLPAACCQLLSAASHLTDRDRAQLFLMVCDVTSEDIAGARTLLQGAGRACRDRLPGFSPPHAASADANAVAEGGLPTSVLRLVFRQELAASRVLRCRHEGLRSTFPSAERRYSRADPSVRSTTPSTTSQATSSADAATSS